MPENEANESLLKRGDEEMICVVFLRGRSASGLSFVLFLTQPLAQHSTRDGLSKPEQFPKAILEKMAVGGAIWL